MSEILELKKELYRIANEIIGEKVERNKLSLQELKESAGSESKSSAGDKHETGRAMVHLEQEKMAQQLATNQSLQSVLVKIDPEISNSVISLGSLVITDKLRFFVSVALGKMELNNREYYLVSLTSPLAKQFIGKQIGDRVTFNEQEYLIEAIV
ncbi:hypothetical protein BZG02_15605 [Labilibaculum filiforme]|uniref:3-oxoacyl-ACP synthase n=1 Tax=Labilibaculum filiforme TaxID=1940526 RepID=A0A2N3HU90_9BACT|nr:3-oxoacyl-ACP synthase [Labilibaculum filiforme]PKQ61609.1 hypothetical protein BZG02_15605 [Labilibaculum filiforme]